MTDTSTDTMDSDSDTQELNIPPTIQKTNNQNPSNPLDEGFVKIYFDQSHFKSSTMLRISSTMTARQVRTLAAQKGQSTVEYSALMIVNATSCRKVIRTISDDEKILELQEENLTLSTCSSRRSSLMDSLKSTSSSSNDSVKFIFKDLRMAPLNIEKELDASYDERKPFIIANLIGNGHRNGYLRKQSQKDPNIWRQRWFVLKTNVLLYCRSWSDQSKIEQIELKGSKVERIACCHAPNAFVLRTSKRSLTLTASSEEQVNAWIHELTSQIQLSEENYFLEQSEEDILQTVQADLKKEPQQVHPAPLFIILKNPIFHSMFKQFMKTHQCWNLYGGWVQCERNRVCCLQKCALFHKRKGQKLCTPETQWMYCRSILENTIPAVRKYIDIDKEYVNELRGTVLKEIKKRRLALALQLDQETTELQFPPSDLLATLQDQLYNGLETGPFQDFMQGNSYHSLIDCTIGR